MSCFSFDKNLQENSINSMFEGCFDRSNVLCIKRPYFTSFFNFLYYLTFDDYETRVIAEILDLLVIVLD